MKKESQIPSQQIISFRFRFVRSPVVWEVLTGARWEQFRAAKLKAFLTATGRALTTDALADFEQRISAEPLLCGRMRKLEARGAEDLTEITDLSGLRDEFFALPERDLNKLALFLNKVGAWPSSGDPSQNTPGYGMKYPVYVEPEDVWGFREDLRHALFHQAWFKESVTPVKRSSKTWLDLFTDHRANDFNLRFELSDVVAGVVTLTNARHALFASVLADVSRRVQFKRCARKGCNVPCVIKNKHKKKFHSEKCGHLALVQNQRKAAKEKRRAEKRQPRKSSH
jgi:hypothetical protein